MESFRRGRTSRKVLKVMIPRPPNWISSRMTVCPSSVYCAVSTVARPVTHTAEVAVNSASMSRRRPSPFQQKGSQRISAPTRMTPVKYENR